MKPIDSLQEDMCAPMDCPVDCQWSAGALNCDENRERADRLTIDFLCAHRLQVHLE